MNEESRPAFSWSVIASGQQGPGARSRHVLVYDRARSATVLFGGLVWAGGEVYASEARLLGDTWELSEGVWRQISVPRGPRARHRSGFVHDVARGRSILFGGQDSWGLLLNDTWSFAEGEWKAVRPWFPGSPPRRCAHAMAYDEAVGATVLFGGIGYLVRTLGDTWLLKGSRWSRVRGPGPAPRMFASMTFDPTLGGCLLHGGSGDEMGHEKFGDTWVFRDGAWSVLPEAFTTEPRDDHGLAHHPVAGTTVMLRAKGEAPGVLCLTPEGWRDVPTGPGGFVHQCSPIVWDPALDGLVMHGGETGQGGRHYDATRALRLLG